MTNPVTVYPLEEITSTEIGTIGTEEIAAMVPEAVAALTNTQIAQLTTTQINSLSTTQINALSATLPVKALTTTQIAGLTTTHVAAMTTTVVGSLTDTVISQLTTTQISLLTTTQLAALTTTQVGAILTNVTTTQIAGLNSTSINALIAATPIDALSDVTVTSILTGDVLTWNGSAFVNGPPITVGASGGNIFFNATPVITATGAENTLPISTLSKVPVTTAEQTVAGTATSNTVPFAAWLSDSAHGDTSIDAGHWGFTTFAGVNSIAGGRSTTLTRNIMTVDAYSGGTTIETTGTGASRTATVTGGTPFPVGIGSATNLLAGWLQTPKGLYQITARASSSIVTIATPTGYVNESGVAFSTWQRLFGAASDSVTAITPAYTGVSFQSTQPAFTVTATSFLGAISFVTSNNTTTLTLVYNGTARNTFFTSAEAVHHNDIASLQGGVPAERYHLTVSEHDAAAQLASSLTTTQIAALSTISGGSLTTTQMAAWGTTEVAALSTAFVTALTSTQITQLTSTNVRQLTTTQLQGLTATQFASLPTTALSGLTSTQVNSITQVKLLSFVYGGLV